MFAPVLRTSKSGFKLSGVKMLVKWGSKNRSERMEVNWVTIQVYLRRFFEIFCPFRWTSCTVLLQNRNIQIILAFANKSLVHFCAPSDHRIEFCQSVRVDFKKLSRLPIVGHRNWNFLFENASDFSAVILGSRGIYQFVELKKSATGNVLNLRRTKFSN